MEFHTDESLMIVPTGTKNLSLLSPLPWHSQSVFLQDCNFVYIFQLVDRMFWCEKSEQIHLQSSKRSF